MVIFYVYMRERAKKSPFYVAYTQIGNLRIGNLRMRRKKLRKPSYVTEPKKSQPILHTVPPGKYHQSRTQKMATVALDIIL